MKRTRLAPGKPLARGKPPPSGTPMARSSLPRNRKRIAPQSAKAKAKSPAYQDARRQVRERAGGWCELRTPVCTKVGQEVQHLAGRVGALLTDVTLMRWSCRECHAHAHANPALAYENGWMVRRTGRNRR